MACSVDQFPISLSFWQNNQHRILLPAVTAKRVRLVVADDRVLRAVDDQHMRLVTTTRRCAQASGSIVAKFCGRAAFTATQGDGQRGHNRLPAPGAVNAGVEALGLQRVGHVAGDALHRQIGRVLVVAGLHGAGSAVVGVLSEGGHAEACRLQVSAAGLVGSREAARSSA